jgi:hypothetical protein
LLRCSPRRSGKWGESSRRDFGATLPWRGRVAERSELTPFA